MSQTFEIDIPGLRITEEFLYELIARNFEKRGWNFNILIKEGPTPEAGNRSSAGEG